MGSRNHGDPPGWEGPERQRPAPHLAAQGSTEIGHRCPPGLGPWSCLCAGAQFSVLSVPSFH